MDSIHVIEQSLVTDAVRTLVLNTFTAYRSKYKAGKHTTVFDFVREVYRGHGVDAIVDVYCEAPEHATWREIADSALTEEDRREKWGGLEYWFVMGARDTILSSFFINHIHVCFLSRSVHRRTSVSISLRTATSCRGLMSGQT